MELDRGRAFLEEGRIATRTPDPKDKVKGSHTSGVCKSPARGSVGARSSKIGRLRRGTEKGGLLGSLLSKARTEKKCCLANGGEDERKGRVRIMGTSVCKKRRNDPVQISSQKTSSPNTVGGEGDVFSVSLLQ